jgi:hypothetical protein
VLAQPGRRRLSEKAVSSQRAQLGGGTSKFNLPDELEVSRVSRTGYRPEGSIAKRTIGIVQGRGVADVKGFGPELKIQTFRQPESFAYHDIGILKARSPDGISRTVPYNELTRRRKGRLVKPG